MNNPLGFCCAILVLMIGSGEVLAQSASIVKFDALARRMSAQNDTTYIFNFFATWCEPCVKELPDFQKLSERYAGQKVNVVFVSLDFKKNYRGVLLPFLKKRHVTNQVLLLDETDYNSWIDKVDTMWDGNLPATLVVNNQKHLRTMYPQEFNYTSLEAAIKLFIQ